MGALGEFPFPGELASPDQLIDLAAEYRAAAHRLHELGRTGEPLSRAPFRLCAIHSIELHLSAFLVGQGYSAKETRRLHHDLGRRADLAVAGGLCLRKRTFEHLKTLSISREYLVTRYGPELANTTSQINRLMATLEEVSAKVRAIFSKPSNLHIPFDRSA